MKLDSRHLISAAAYSLASLVIVKLVSMATSIAVARQLGPVNLGMFGVVTNLTALLSFFCMFGLPTALAKFLPEEENGGDRGQGILRTAVTLMAVVTIPVSAGLFACSDWLAAGLYRQPELGLLFKISAVTVGLISFGQLVTAVFQGMHAIKQLSLVTMANSLIGVPIIVGLVFSLGLLGITMAALITALLFALLAWRHLKPLLGQRGVSLVPRLDRQAMARLASYALPTFLCGLAAIPPGWLITTMLSRTTGFQEVAFFNLSNSLVQVILFLPSAISMPLLPLISRHSRDGALAQQEFRKVFRTAVMLCAAVSVMSSLLSRPLLVVLYGDRYQAAWEIMLLLSGSAFLNGVSYLTAIYFAAVGLVWIGVLFNAIWFVILIGGTWLLTPMVGLNGVGLSYIAAYAVFSLIMLSYLRIRFGFGLFTECARPFWFWLAAFPLTYVMALKLWGHFSFWLLLPAVALSLYLAWSREWRELYRTVIDHLRPLGAG